MQEFHVLPVKLSITAIRVAWNIILANTNVKTEMGRIQGTEILDMMRIFQG
jgi:hypothetical protein